MYGEYLDNKKEFKILICLPDKRWIDVSKKRAVIYGAGQGCFDIMDEIQLPNICAIVDSDKSKWGEEIQLLNTIYKIQSPAILSSLSIDENYLVISSNKYKNEIEKTIKENVKGKSFLICSRENIFYCYKQLEDMLYYDPLIKRKLVRFNLSFAIDDIISLFENVSAHFKNIIIDRFIPMKKGDSKLIFFFGTEDDLWVFSIPGYHNEFEKMAISRDKCSNKKMRCELRKRLCIDNQITLFENENVLIQKYADEYIDFSSEEIKKRVLKKCRTLHQINEKINIKNDMIRRYSSDLIKKVIRGGTASIKEVREVEQSMVKPLERLTRVKYVPKLCHCDLICSNIVCFKKELYFIDWEYMAMSDPIFDVCSYLFSTGMMLCNEKEKSYEKALTHVYTLLRQDLAIYFNRDCTEEEYLHAFLVMLLFEYKNLLCESLYGKNIDKKKVYILLERINSSTLI